MSMTFRFFKLATSLLLLCSPALLAQTAAPPSPNTPVEQKAPKEDEKKPKEGYIRFWNILPNDGGELQLLQDNGAGEPTVVLAGDPQNFFAIYKEFKPGRYVLKVVRSSEPKNILKSFDILLRADVYVSILAKMVDGKVVAEMIDDTYDPQKVLTGRVTFRQLTPKASVLVKVRGGSDFGPLAENEERQVDNLPLKPIFFQMQAVVDGKLQMWPAEIDFRRGRRATVWIVTDGIGRFRPRVCLDGPTVDPETPVQVVK
jgi:hypothetical protein